MLNVQWQCCHYVKKSNTNQINLEQRYQSLHIWVDNWRAVCVIKQQSHTIIINGKEFCNHKSINKDIHAPTKKEAMRIYELLKTPKSTLKPQLFTYHYLNKLAQNRRGFHYVSQSGNFQILCYFVDFSTWNIAERWLSASSLTLFYQNGYVLSSNHCREAQKKNWSNLRLRSEGIMVMSW